MFPLKQLVENFSFIKRKLQIDDLVYYFANWFNKKIGYDTDHGESKEKISSA